MIKNSKLEIFDNFITDYELPKHKKEITPDPQPTLSSIYTLSPNSTSSSISPTSWISAGNTITQTAPMNSQKQKKSFFQKIIDHFRKKSPKETFRLIFNSKEELSSFEERVTTYKKLIEQTKKNGQIAFMEKLISNEISIVYESQLYSIGFNKCISEETLVKICTNCLSGLKLDWIKNYIRIIPEEATEKKFKLDALKIFDNYVILHYDPENKNSEKTIKEKDPILFGVIRGVRKLYFVHDWIDEYCDLTFEKLINKLSDAEKNKLEIKKDSF